MVEYIHHLFEFTAEESCGKCFPGRLGSYRGKEMFDQAKNKTAKIPLKLLNELANNNEKRLFMCFMWCDTYAYHEYIKIFW